MEHQYICMTRDEGSYLLRIKEYGEPGQWVFDLPDELVRRLSLIKGIGKYRELRLKEKGYADLYSLLVHRSWGDRACKLIEMIRNNDIAGLALSGAKDSEILSLSKPEDMVYLDIETTGLDFTRPIFLIGLLSLSERGNLRLEQMMARDYNEERALLAAFAERVSSYSIVVTYNGRTFDVPFLNARLSYHRLDGAVRQYNVDLLRSTRRLYRGLLPNFRLGTVEESILGVKREDDMPGSMVPIQYSRFMESGDIGLIEGILRHNEQDLVSLSKLLFLAAI